MIALGVSGESRIRSARHPGCRAHRPSGRRRSRRPRDRATLARPARAADASRCASGPARATVRVHHSSTDAARYGVGSSLTSTSANPASSSNASTRPASSSENGPGTPGGGTGAPSTSVTESKTTPSHGLRSRGPQTVNATRPPGRSTRRISRAARAGSPTSMIASRQTTTSYDPSGSSISSRSSTRVPTLLQPELVDTRGRDRDHRGRDVREDDLARLADRTPPRRSRHRPGRSRARAPARRAAAPSAASSRSVTPEPRASMKTACSSQPAATELPHPVQLRPTLGHWQLSPCFHGAPPEIYLITRYV